MAVTPSAAERMLTTDMSRRHREDVVRSRPLLRVALALLWTLALADAAFAQASTWTDVAAPDISPRKIFFMLFLMLGPIKILMPFAAMTEGTSAAFRSELATRSILFSTAAIALAGFLGRGMMANFNVSLPVLALAGGLVLFLVALQTVLQQTLGSGPGQKQFAGPPGPHLAFNPLAFPITVTPHGIAAVIVFVTLADSDRRAEFAVAVIVLSILAMDWVAMIFANVILKWLGTTLQVFAVILGIAQVALGLQVIFHSLRLLDVFVGRPG